MNASIRALAAAGMCLVTSCAVAPTPRLTAPPDPAAVLSRLHHDEATTQTVAGRARLTFDGPHGGGSGAQVVVVALPDRARVEALTPLGTTALVATVRGDSLEAHSPVQHVYWTGPATSETLGRLLHVPVPPALLLRVLAGLPPLPVRANDPRVTVVSEGATVRVESVDGEHWQRLWTEPDDPAVGRGVVGRASEAMFTFTFAERRPVGGRDFPFEIRVEETGWRTRVQVQYHGVQLNRPTAPELFEVPPPTDPQTQRIDLSTPR